MGKLQNFRLRRFPLGVKKSWGAMHFFLKFTLSWPPWPRGGHGPPTWGPGKKYSKYLRKTCPPEFSERGGGQGPWGAQGGQGSWGDQGGQGKGQDI